jgi:16S rRNA pseudouridine516 synthase
LRLDKLLSNQGYGTRSEARAALRGGRVTVNGETERDGARYVDPALDIIALDGERVDAAPAPAVMMNKPAGVVTSTDDRHNKVVIDLLPAIWRARGLKPVGRLDIDTTGLLLFTDDGDLAHRLITPKRKVGKLYRAVLDAPVTDEDIAVFEAGAPMRGYTAMPAKLERDPSADAVALVTVHEGRYHQVKLMFASRGRSVLSLERLAIGPVRLDPALQPGACRALAPDEESALRESCGAADRNAGR